MCAIITTELVVPQPKTLSTDVASPCVHCFREAGSCVSVLHAYFSCMRMIHRRGFSTLVLFITTELVVPQHQEKS